MLGREDYDAYLARAWEEYASSMPEVEDNACHACEGVGCPACDGSGEEPPLPGEEA